jgi:hypothetical protein
MGYASDFMFLVHRHARHHHHGHKPAEGRIF